MFSSTNIRYIACVISCLSTLLSFYSVILSFKKPAIPDKYGDIVTVYKIGDVSIELCGGPHVSNTKELGHFKIKKEEASSSGVRRIKAILE